jgi:DNA-binding transcriptional ArsR family regulator
VLDCVVLDGIFHALSDPWRRWIVQCLSDGEAASVGQIAEPLPIALATILQHLKVLEASGLVHTQKVGRVRTCRIEPQALLLLDEWITPRRRLWDRRLQQAYPDLFR